MRLRPSAHQAAKPVARALPHAMAIALTTIDYSGTSESQVRSSEARLRIGQLIVVSLGGILGEVLYKLPVIAFGIVEVDALPVRVRVWDRRFSVTCCFEPC